MRITMLWPFGSYQPGDVVDVDPRIADVMTRECFARPSGQPAPAVAAEGVSLADLRSFAATNDCSLAEARDRIAADRETAHSEPPSPPSATKETPSCA